jgi:LytS/YehU family sensor histidine kinase
MSARDARFMALRAQVNPHFMFNTLNAEAVLVRDGEQSAATRIVERSSDVLPRTLDRNRRAETSLDEELELVRQHVAIEHARFSDRLQPHLAIRASHRRRAP